MSNVKIGQRWRWSDHDTLLLDFVMEITDQKIGTFVQGKIIQLISNGSSFNYEVGSDHSFYPFPSNTEETNRRWHYLSGQDRPKDSV